MSKLLSAVLAATVLFVPAALAQETPAAPAAPAAGAAPAASEAPAASQQQLQGEAPPPEAIPEAEERVPAEEAPLPAEPDPGIASEVPGEEHEAGATPHYPLIKPVELDWSFAGLFGHWDLGQLQRGLKVYREVCASCHSMNLVAMRSLEALGYSEEQVRAFAAEYTVTDGPGPDGEMFDRPAIPSDRFPAPFPNPESAAAALGAVPPDFSLIAKARAVERGFPTFIFDIFTLYAENGPDYIYSLLTGYEEPPAGLEIPPGTYYNPHFISGPAIAMAPPLSDGQVEYPDGAPETVDQYARDVSAFLMWAAEPHLVERKATGIVVLLFLAVFAVMLYFVKRRVWNDTAH